MEVTASVSIDTPHPNEIVQDTIPASGILTLTVLGGTPQSLQNLAPAVKVGFGAGPLINAAVGRISEVTSPLRYRWSCTGTVPSDAVAGAPMHISVAASVRFFHIPSDSDTAEDSAAVVVITRAPPVLTVEPFATESSSPPYVLTFRGTASEAGSTIAAVQFRVDDGAFAGVDNDPSGDFATWSKTIELPAGEHTLTIQAIDTHQIVASQHFDIAVRAPFEPTAIAQVFAPTTYLRELLEFASRQVQIGSTSAGPSAQVLARRFCQPFDGLTDGKTFEQAMLPVQQCRIAIEVLRLTIKPDLLAQVDQRFRSAAYQAILRELGTSHEELRLARVADAASRRSLAARIGIGIDGPRPDHLDQITFLPDSVTDVQLQELFGYQSTAPADALLPVAAEPAFLIWRFASLRAIWRLNDEQTRDGASGAVPIIDPDLIDQSNLVTTEADNPAFALWTARKSWIATTLASIEHQAATEPNPLTRFDAVVRKFVGSIDLAALADRDARGEDVTLDVRSFNLDLDAFQFLARCRELLVGGILLQSEVQDIHAILLQAQKRSQYLQWRTEERRVGLILEPSQFQTDVEGDALEIPRWRGSSQTLSQWRRALLARAAQKETAASGYRTALGAVEAQTLPGLRNAVLEVIGQQQPTPEDLNAVAERLTRHLLIDLRANAGAKTTRVAQALETLQGILFSVRSGRLTSEAGGAWALKDEQAFDAEWQWMGSYRTWLAAIRVFAYPEDQLFPNLYLPDGLFLKPTQAFIKFLEALRQAFKVTPKVARDAADEYLKNLRLEVPAAATQLPEGFLLTDQLSNADLIQRRGRIFFLFGTVSNLADVPQYLHEVFWLVPVTLALRLQNERAYLAALDWFQTVYAFNLPPEQRKIYRGLAIGAPSTYVRVPEWLTKELNPHIIARKRQNSYTRFTVMSIVRCLLAYADSEFSRNATESIARARTLYETSSDLLQLADVRSETGPTIPFPDNPVWESLRLQAQSSLAKIHNGFNIAGIPMVDGPEGASSFLPSQYRYAVLVERAKNLVGIAEQLESAFLSALERGDAEEYSLFQANHDIQVARATISLQDLKVVDADINVAEAQSQQEKATIQRDHYDQLIREGLNGWEEAATAAMGAQVLARAIGVKTSFFPTVTDPFDIHRAVSAAAELAAATAQLAQTEASYERRKEDWQLQKNLADKEVQIGGLQIGHARNQKLVALQEQALAGLQLDHTEAVVDFLANKFTNAELFEWMSGVLGGVYAYFLQQATAVAQLAQAQLAFERQEPAPGFVHSDYWQDTPDGAPIGSSDSSDRRGLTGSARLLQDIFRLDQYAFETDRRKLHLTHTLSLSQIAPLELQRLRETGLLVFATPMDMFDREFPGHYLRLVKRIKTSIVALVPPVRGVRATLSASGLSRVTVGGDEFAPVTISRPPEAIAFTSPLNATGLFDLEAESGLLLPFEGMGVDAVWQLDLPKAVNPFDYRTIADVLLTIEYTALNSFEYRQEILHAQDRGFGGDRTFSLRDQFPDAWYELNNPENVSDEASRMRATLALRREDFPPHLEELAVQDLALFCVRKDGFAGELRIVSLQYISPNADTVTTTEVLTTGGIVGTRRPTGAAWEPLVGKNPVGQWSIQLENTEFVRGAIKNELIQDLVLVVTVNGVTPAWN